MTNQAALGVGSRPGLSAASQVSDPALIARILVLAGRLFLWGGGNCGGGGGGGVVQVKCRPAPSHLSLDRPGAGDVVTGVGSLGSA